MRSEKGNRPAGVGGAEPGDHQASGINLNGNADVEPVGLRATLQATGLALGAVTVLSVQNDPFRVDTPAHHRDGAWLAGMAGGLGLGNRLIHLRGLHYMMIGQIKPNGLPYTNTDEDWTWLSERAAKAARWLGYIAFEQIIDNRNTPPVTRPYEFAPPSHRVLVGAYVDIPDVDDITPTIDTIGFAGRQLYRLVLFGEKSSLEAILGPVAERFQADLYLPTGEISDTQMHIMASHAAADGRKLIVFTFSDCDPAGWQMPLSIARKLQAFRAGFFPDLEFEVHRVGLTPDQVRRYNLPSTPLKDSERRDDRWKAEMGTEQTEIDSLAALQPDLLRTMARRAIEPFYDDTLAGRSLRAERRWQEEAQARIDAAIGSERMDEIRQQALDRIEQIREQAEGLDIDVDVDDVELPEKVIPEPEIGSTPTGLVDSEWDFTEQCDALIKSKRYES